MPRKRKTRTTTQARTKPKIPDGDEGYDLDKDLKAEKMRTLLADFDTEMSSFFSSIKADMMSYEKAISCSYTMCLAKLPSYIRDMDMDEYLRLGGEVTSEAVTKEATEQIEMSLGTAKPLASLGKSKKKKGKKSATQDESGTVRRRATRKDVNMSVVENMPPPSTLRSRRTKRLPGQLETPFQRGGPSKAGWETPLVTPKFDPRLPITPTRTRRPKMGEVFLSLAGSPLTNDTDGRQTMTIKKGAKSGLGKIMVENTELDLDNIKIPDYEQTTKDYLRLLREKLNAIPLSPGTPT